MDINSVIKHGHSAKLPLMCPASELTDGFEPHDTIWSAGWSVVACRVVGVAGGGVPGVVQLGGCREGAIPGTNPEVKARPD